MRDTLELPLPSPHHKRRSQSITPTDRRTPSIFIEKYPPVVGNATKPPHDSPFNNRRARSVHVKSRVKSRRVASASLTPNDRERRKSTAGFETNRAFAPDFQTDGQIMALPPLERRGSTKSHGKSTKPSLARFR